MSPLRVTDRPRGRTIRRATIRRRPENRPAKKTGPLNRAACYACGRTVLARRLHHRQRDGAVRRLCVSCVGLDGVGLG